MTLSVAWLRNAIGSPELVFASDSRVSGGEVWDRYPKIFQLSRSDCLISFSGPTDYAFPLVMQLNNAIAAFDRSRRGETDLSSVKGHALRVFNDMYADLQHFPPSSDVPDPVTQFTFGGWSWKTSQFRIWHLDWDGSQKAFSFRNVRHYPDLPDAVAWFDGSTEAVWDTHVALERLLRRRTEQGLASRLNMEPLQLLVAAIRSNAYHDVGGAPQVGKVFRHMNTQLVKVEWPHEENEIATFLAGRPLLPYEAATGPVVRAKVSTPTEEIEEALATARSDRAARTKAGSWHPEKGAGRRLKKAPKAQR